MRGINNTIVRTAAKTGGGAKIKELPPANTEPACPICGMAPGCGHDDGETKE